MSDTSMNHVVDSLVVRAREGDRAAFASIVRRYLPSVEVIVSGAGRGLPEELCRETFRRAWRGLRGLPESADFREWLTGIARYVEFDSRRRREPFEGARFAEPDRRREPVFAALRQLDPVAKEALLARHLDRLDRVESAGRLGITVDELDAAIARGRAALRRLLPASPAR